MELGRLIKIEQLLTRNRKDILRTMQFIPRTTPSYQDQLQLKQEPPRLNQEPTQKTKWSSADDHLVA